jgi:thiol-disulfide isomerase/thioredoxin
MKWLLCLGLTGSVLFSICSIAAQTTDTDAIMEGHLSQKEVASRCSWFEDGKQKYTPDESTVKALLPYARQLGFVVVLGTWCGDSQKHVPPFYRLMEVLRIPEKRIELIGVDRKKQAPVDIAPLHIEHVPTFIVFYKGKELGRIVENPNVSIEKDLLQMLQNPAVSSQTNPKSE